MEYYRSVQVAGGVRCRICELAFVPEEPNDRKMHKEEHEKLARGSLPHDVHEFLKAFGWAVAHNDGGVDRLKDRQDKEVGKLAVAYSWWARARMLGINESEFDDYMAAHIHFIDVMVEKNAEKIATARKGIQRWEQYAG